jgi:hypothetical protein
MAAMMQPRKGEKNMTNDIKKMEKEMRKVFMNKLTEEFKDFVSESIDEGYAAGFDDHLDFLEACFTVFIEMKSE